MVKLQSEGLGARFIDKYWGARRAQCCSFLGGVLAFSIVPVGSTVRWFHEGDAQETMQERRTLRWWGGVSSRDAEDPRFLDVTSPQATKDSGEKTLALSCLK